MQGKHNGKNGSYIKDELEKERVPVKDEHPAKGSCPHTDKDYGVPCRKNDKGDRQAPLTMIISGSIAIMSFIEKNILLF
jgi:hypothetical protein